jgi:ABC-type arginine transport system ATPase subunit
MQQLIVTVTATSDGVSINSNVSEHLTVLKVLIEAQRAVVGRMSEEALKTAKPEKSVIVAPSGALHVLRKPSEN